MDIQERLLIELVKKFKPKKKIMQTPFPVMTYDEAMNLYGSDKPDLRFNLAFTDVTDIASECGFSVFKSAVDAGGVVKAMKVDGGSKFSRKDIDELTEVAKIYKAKGLAYIVVEEDGLRSPIVKFFKEEEVKEIIDRTEAKAGDVIFFAADSFEVACESLGHVRLSVAKKLDIVDPDLFAFCWVIDFPMFEKDQETGAIAAMHHPFTSPKDTKEFAEDPENAIANAYDIALNGNEIAGGSIRIHDSEVQKKVFDILNVSDEDAQRRFGHMLEAFKFGAPPHGGIAWGLDRLVMIFADEPNIREVIAFPKDQKAKDLMLGAPSPMPEEQLEELHVKIDIEDEEDED